MNDFEQSMLMCWNSLVQKVFSMEVTTKLYRESLARFENCFSPSLHATALNLNNFAYNGWVVLTSVRQKNIFTLQINLGNIDVHQTYFYLWNKLQNNVWFIYTILYWPITKYLSAINALIVGVWEFPPSFIQFSVSPPEVLLKHVPMNGRLIGFTCSPSSSGPFNAPAACRVLTFVNQCSQGSSSWELLSSSEIYRTQGEPLGVFPSWQLRAPTAPFTLIHSPLCSPGFYHLHNKLHL